MRAEIDHRHQIETKLLDLNRELESRISERTAQLSESETRFRTLAEAVPNFLWATDASGNRTYVSRRYEEFTGAAAQELLGDGWMAALHPDDRMAVRAAWREAVAKGEAYELEYRLRRFDGTYHWFVARAVPVRGTDNRIEHWFGSSTDIDAMKHTEAALRRSNEELRQFAYAAAHDLQEPIRNVRTCVGFIKQVCGPILTEIDSKWMDMAIEGAQRMHELVKDLLTYSRAIDPPDHPLELVPAEVAVNAALRNLREMVITTTAQVEIDRLPSVPVYQTHLVQLFQNLLSNALKYRKSDVAPQIHISASRQACQWHFSVSDNGIGFRPEYAEKIFGVFKRLHLRTEYPGNGIGLAICARVVAHYGGRIWADSQPGEGAVFHFTLPADQDCE
jgi:PAS domain S-box-containing protein